MPVTHARERSTPDTPVHTFTLGVEEELFVVDPQSLAPTGCTEELLRPGRFTRGAITGEMCDGVIETATPVCANVDEAIAAAAQLREEIARRGVALIGSGLHPTLAFGDVAHRRSAHYDLVSEQTRSLLRQSTYCGVHVHIAMPDPETTIAAFNGMRKWIPVLQALGANSPFWHGQDSGLASARTVVCHSVPRTGLPRAFRDWADYQATIDELCRVADVPNARSFWWDMRPHPTLGTLEIRCIDAQSSTRDLAGLVALTHVLACHEATVAGTRDPAPEILAEATYRALRDGIDSRLSLGGPVLSLREHVRHALDLASGYAPSLGASRALGEVERLLAEGNGATRQRHAHERGGIRAVLEHLRSETMGVTPREQRPAVA